jgi:protease I
MHLQNKKVAILTDHGFEEVELTGPKEALEKAGATVHIISMHESVKGWDHDHWSAEIKADIKLDEAKFSDYDALVIPGGVINPDRMRANFAYVEFAQQFMESGKTVAAICHGPQLLIETGMLSGREMTSYPSIKTDLENAGAIWVDKEVVFDHGLITSRNPQDLPAFNNKLIEEISQGIHATISAFTTPFVP